MVWAYFLCGLIAGVVLINVVGSIMAPSMFGELLNLPQRLEAEAQRDLERVYKDAACKHFGGVLAFAGAIEAVRGQDATVEFHFGYGELHLHSLTDVAKRLVLDKEWITALLPVAHLYVGDNERVLMFPCDRSMLQHERATIAKRIATALRTTRFTYQTLRRWWNTGRGRR